MKRFEYSIIAVSSEEMENSPIDYLNQKGQEGWELVQHDYIFSQEKYMFVFKREIDNEVFAEVD